MKEHETHRPYEIALDYDDAFARSPLPAPVPKSDAAGYPHSWSPRTAPSVHQQWLDDQAVFMRPPRALDRESGAYAVSHSLPPRGVGGKEIGVLAAAAVIGLTLAGVSAAVLWQRDAPPVAASRADVSAPSQVVQQRAPSRAPRSEPAPAIAAAPAPEPRAASPAVDTRPAPRPRAKPEPVAVTPSAPVAVRAAPVAPAADPEPAPVVASAPPEAPPPEEPEPEEPAVPAGPPGEFDRDAARSAMFGAAARAAGCGVENGPTGRGRVAVTVAPGGSVTSVSVGPPFGGSSVGGCVASAFRAVVLPPFTGSSVTLHKSFDIAAPKSRVSAAAEEPAPEAPSPKKRASNQRASKKRARRGSRKHKVSLE